MGTVDVVDFRMCGRNHFGRVFIISLNPYALICLNNHIENEWISFHFSFTPNRFICKTSARSFSPRIYVIKSFWYYKLPARDRTTSLYVFLLDHFILFHNNYAHINILFLIIVNQNDAREFEVIQSSISDIAFACKCARFFFVFFSFLHGTQKRDRERERKKERM